MEFLISKGSGEKRGKIFRWSHLSFLKGPLFLEQCNTLQEKLGTDAKTLVPHTCSSTSGLSGAAPISQYLQAFILSFMEAGLSSLIMVYFQGSWYI